MRTPKTGWLRFEVIGFGLLIVLLNLPLFGGTVADPFIYLPGNVSEGEWWRLLTHPFVHVSLYHLVLDAAAFLFLYASLTGWTPLGRLAAVAACGGGALAVSATVPTVATIGLCGLSGIAHGLMAVSATQMLERRDRVEQVLGAIALGALIVKTVIESVTGEVLFSSLHVGSVGVPITACHAGGVLGGLLLVACKQRLIASSLWRGRRPVAPVCRPAACFHPPLP